MLNALANTDMRCCGHCRLDIVKGSISFFSDLLSANLHTIPLQSKQFLLHVYAAVRLPLKLLLFHIEGSRRPGHSHQGSHKLVQSDLQCSLLLLVP